jgi:hypothetical protein
MELKKTLCCLVCLWKVPNCFNVWRVKKDVQGIEGEMFCAYRDTAWRDKLKDLVMIAQNKNRNLWKMTRSADE